MENFVRDVHPRPPEGRVRLVRIGERVIPVPESWIRDLKLTFYKDGEPLDLDEITLGMLP